MSQVWMILLLVGTAGCAMAQKPPPLTLQLIATFKPKQPNDGAPTVHYRYVFANSSDGDLYLNLWGGSSSLPFLRAVGPRSLFQITIMERGRTGHGGMPSPPTRADVLKVPARGTATHKGWDWVGMFTVEAKNKRMFYVIKKPGIVTLESCFRAAPIAGRFAEQLKAFLPSGAEFWGWAGGGETICAKPARVHIRALGKEEVIPLPMP